MNIAHVYTTRTSGFKTLFQKGCSAVLAKMQPKHAFMEMADWVLAEAVHEWVTVLVLTESRVCLVLAAVPILAP